MHGLNHEFTSVGYSTDDHAIYKIWTRAYIIPTLPSPKMVLRAFRLPLSLRYSSNHYIGYLSAYKAMPTGGKKYTISPSYEIVQDQPSY
jgi:hypothetical protein